MNSNMNMNHGWALFRPFFQLAVLHRHNQNIPRRFLSTKTSQHRRVSDVPVEDIYHPEVDVEYLEDYVPGGYHQCLVGEPAGSNIAKFKEDSTSLMFPVDAARSAAAQLLLGSSYLHANGICHGDEDNYAVCLGLLIPHTNHMQISICATFTYDTRLERPKHT